MDKDKLGHYELRMELGRGGMGVVYKAHDPTLNRDVAIKVLSEALAHDTSVVERFMREAKSMAALNDSHIIQIYYIGEDHGQPYFVMEFVEGESLSQRLKRDGKLPVKEACRIIRETAEGLELAHSKGVIHRDIKPGNLMLTPRGKVKIADFGIAMVQDFDKRLTNTGEFVGTPGYLSPEVCVGQPVDHRSDIFALGIVFFEMLTGKIPFSESSPLGMMLEVVKAEIPDVRSINTEVDDRTCNILKRMIAKDPDQRYQSCEELVIDLVGSGPVEAPGTMQTGSAFEQAATSVTNQLESLPELEGRVDTPPPQPATQISTPGQARPAPEPVADSRSGVGGMAIAAVLLLAIGGGSLYLFRDAIFGGGGEPDRPQVNISTPAESGTTGEADPPATEAAIESSADAQTPGRELVSDAELEAEIQQLALVSGDAQEVAAASEAPPPVAEQPQARQAAPSQAMPVETRQAAETAPADPPADPPVRTEQREPVQVAKATRPEPRREPPPPPRDPRVVVVAIGDRAIAGPVEQMLEDALGRDHVLLDESFFSGIGSVASERGVDLPGLSNLILDNGGDILVLAEVDYLGETPLQYYGQVSTLYSVQLKVRNILLSERRPVGGGWQTKVDFTNLNADQKAREAVEPHLADLTAALKGFKRG